MEKKEKIKRSLIVIIIIVVACTSMIVARNKKKKNESNNNQEVVLNGDFTTDIIKVVNKNNKSNYLISPYSIEIALNMLREGAGGKTKEEIDKVIGNRTINDVSVKDKISIANGIFIKDDYKYGVKNDFINIMNTKYQAEILYDEFKTPDVLNNWVKEKTNGMIDKVIDEVNRYFVMGLVNALALDVEWSNSFGCEGTTSEEFTKIDNNKINVEMMHKSYENNAKYIKTDDAVGIIIPYKKHENSNVELEFVALLPNNNVNDYVNSLSTEKINKLFDNVTMASDKIHINLSLPRFTYDYEIKDFIEVLKEMGIIEAFDEDKADFKKMIELRENVFVGEAVHKTKIELNEKGTKAAAVTYIGMFSKSALVEKNYEEIDIKFNKPFIYMIREKNTGEILFFGSLYEPNIWKGNTCS